MLNAAKHFLRVVAIPLFDDNYTYILFGTKANQGVLIDPADPPKVLEHLKSLSDLKISHILYTHKHWDHANGSLELIAELQKQ